MQGNDTLTRARIADAIQLQLGLSNRESLDLVCSILEHMCSALARGENVKISNFGSFLLRDKSKRVGRNPKTGEAHAIEPRRVLTFRASTKIKARIVRADEEVFEAEIARPHKRANQG